jgi:hypothetical protein
MDRYKVPQPEVENGVVVPMRGGMITVRERPLLGFGEKSLVQNIRCWHPGFETRNGYTKLNTTAYNAAGGSPKNLYQFVKGKVSEKHMFGQFGNDDLVEFTNAPPSTGTTLGTVVHTGSSNSIVGSFANINDYMIYSNGVDQHQIYAGEDQDISAFILVKDTGAHDLFPEQGEDYTEEMTDGDSSTVAVLDSLGDYATDYDAIYVMTKTPVDVFNITVSAANGTSADIKVDYWTGSWTNNSVTDTTASGGATLAQTGTITFSTLAASRTTEIPRMMFNQSGFWYKIYLDTGDSLDSETEISAMTYDCESFIDLVNVWNGVPTDLVEAQFYDASDGVYDVYSTASITLDEMTTSDKLYLSSNDQLEGIYFDFGNTPNTNAPTVTIKYWDGDSWADVTEVDGTNTFKESGWIHFGRQTGEHKLQFRNTKYYAYWYEITVSAALSDATSVSVLGMPYYDIDTLGKKGRLCATWKNRALYTFNKFPRDIYVSEAGEHMKLNGSDYAILQPGDGRDNASVACVNFHNEIMVFQEERGAKGGCVTIFEGYSPATFGKLVLSTQVGSFNPKTVAVVDGSKTSSTKRDLNSQTQVFFLSHYGVFMSDGRIVTCISDDIQNYFDPRFSECIRTGYEDEMWLEWDSTENLIKIGIVSGSSATTCNKYFCYDLTDGVWYEDVYGDSISVFREVEAASGQFHTIQIAGSSALGFIYRMNNGTDDAGTAIDAKITWEFSNGPFLIDISEILTRVKVQGSSTTYTCSVEENDVEVDTVPTGAMSAKVTNETLRRNRHLLNAGNIPWISFSIRNNTSDEKMYIYDMAVLSKAKQNK